MRLLTLVALVLFLASVALAVSGFVLTAVVFFVFALLVLATVL